MRIIGPFPSEQTIGKLGAALILQENFRQRRDLLRQSTKEEEANTVQSIPLTVSSGSLNLKGALHTTVCTYYCNAENFLAEV